VHLYKQLGIHDNEIGAKANGVKLGQAQVLTNQMLVHKDSQVILRKAILRIENIDKMPNLSQE